MPSRMDALQTMPPVALRQFPNKLHSVAKQASFRIAFRSDFGGFGRPKWMPKSMFEAHFFPCFFRMRLRIDVGSIFWGSEPWKSSSRLDGNTIFAKSTFSKKVRKNIDFGFIFGSQTEENSIKNRFEKCVFFLHRFLCVFWRFRFHFEVQKSFKNR